MVALLWDPPSLRRLIYAELLVQFSTEKGTSQLSCFHKLKKKKKIEEVEMLTFIEQEGFNLQASLKNSRYILTQKRECRTPWPVWLRWLDVVLCTRKWLIQIQVEGTCPEWALYPQQGAARSMLPSHTNVFLFPSASSLSKNQTVKNKRECRTLCSDTKDYQIPYVFITVKISHH